MKKIKYLEKYECGTTMYNAATKKYGCYCGMGQSGNYNIYLIHWDGNNNPSRVNVLDLEQRQKNRIYVLDSKEDELRSQGRFNPDSVIERM